MDIINQKVEHITMGTGTITAQTGPYIVVSFSSAVHKFIYPDVFIKFMKAVDSTVQTAILQEIETAQKIAAEKEQAQDAACKASAKTPTADDSPYRSLSTKVAATPIQLTPSQRQSGKPMVFFVFQGSTFDKEFRGGYLWAPIANKAGICMHHWTRLLDVRGGDIILHGYNGHIAAISTARGPCYDCVQPEELRMEDLWERNGRRIDCDYIIIQHPIKTSTYRNAIIKSSGVKYSPFRADGSGNMGYLFEIDRDLAKLFLSESVKYNRYLLASDIIKAFLVE